MKPLSNQALTFLIAALIEDIDARDRAAGRVGITAELLHMIAALHDEGASIRPPLTSDRGAGPAAELLHWLRRNQHPETAHPAKQH